MEKIIFYSFKGGSGRTTLLANIAFELARNFDVAMVDLDIFSSGLSLLFDLPPAIDYIQDIIENDDYDALDRYVHNIRNRPNPRRNLYIIPATNRINDYANPFNIASIIKLENSINEYFRDKEIQYLFYDSPSGLSNLPLYLIKKPERSNIFITLKNNIQNISGTRYFIEWISNNMIDMSNIKKFYLIANMIPPNTEEAELQSLNELNNLLIKNGFSNVGEPFIINEMNSLRIREYILGRDQIINNGILNENQINNDREIIYNFIDWIIDNVENPEDE